MKYCPICNGENNDDAEICVLCGNRFVNPNTDNSQVNSQHEIQNNEYNNQNQFNNQQPNFNQVDQQNIPNQAQFNNPNQFNNNNPNQFNNNNPNQFNNNSPYQNNRPQNQKSKAVGIILNMILVGLGYAYVGKWGEGIVLLVLYLILWALAFLIVPIVIAVILWVYSLIKTNEMIDKYNQGIPY